MRRCFLSRSIAAATLLLVAGLASVAAIARDGLDPSSLVKPLAESWPTYSGDYSGRRYSALTQITKANVKGLTLAWVSRLTPGAGGGGFGSASPSRTIVGGEGAGEIASGQVTVKGAILAVDGV